MTHAVVDGERGFTLIELLVAMAAGLVVVFAASALMINALHVTSQVSARVQAVQEGRTGLEHLLQQLDSGCVANDVSPVQATTATGITPAVTSGDSQLVFVSGVGDSVDATPTEHVVSIQNNALVDVSYPNTGGDPPSLGTPATWTFSSTPSGIETLLERAAAEPGTPLFRYYSYSNPSNPTANSLVGAKPLSALSSTTAPTVAQVDIELNVQPTSSANDASSSTEMDDSATFRLTSADPSSENYPCD